VLAAIRGIEEAISGVETRVMKRMNDGFERVLLGPDRRAA